MVRARRILGVSILPVAALLAATTVGPSLGAGGQSTLDPTFGEDGVQARSPGSAPFPALETEAEGRAIQPLADGSSIVAGSGRYDASGTSIVVAALSASGTYTDYGTDHVGPTTYDAATDVLVDAQDRVVVVGTTETAQEPFTRRIVLERYTSDLTLDPTFGDQGRTIVALGDDAAPVKVQEGPDGSYVVSGFRNDLGRGIVLRFDEDGTPDAGFGADGVVSVPGARSVSGLVVTPDNKVVVIGDGSGTSARGFVARLLPDGAVDPTFSGDGRLAVGGAAFSDVVRLADGSLVAYGLAARDGYRFPLRLVRISSAGALASWPGTSSSQRTLATPWSEAVRTTALTLAPDGKLVMTGTQGSLGSPDGTADPFVVRTTSSGVYDPTFAGGGRTTVYFPNAGQIGIGFNFGMDVGVDPQGRTLMVGNAVQDRDNLAVARFTGSLAPRTPAFAIKQGLSTWGPKSCGATDAARCAYAAGAKVRVEGRVWPVPTDRTVTLNLVPVGGGDKVATQVPVTREGNYWATLTPPAGRYQARVVTPASSTTVVARSAWTYFALAGA